MSDPGFSVVMAVYHGDVPDQVFAAGKSVFDQTRVPDELIVVFDGPVPAPHEEAVKRIAKLGCVRVLRLGKSLGPGGARHCGIVASAFDIVAVMDADDLCVSARFEKQFHALSSDGVDVVGGWIREFESQPGDRDSIRKVPERHEELLRYAKRRSPMNNVTAMFRKAKYLEAGGYTCMPSLEDYDLYVRMLLHGARFRNLPEVLVEVRGGREMFKRRGGWAQIPIESKMLYRMYRWGFFTRSEFVSNWVIRTTMRLLPNWMRRAAYLIALRG